MNRPVPPSDFRNEAPAYDADAYGWAMHQAALIRAGERETLDWENIAEEIESMGRSEYRVAESALRILLLHLLKWQHQPTHRSRSWAASIREHRTRFDEQVADNPSLKTRTDEMRVRAYRKARYEAAVETGFAIDVFPADPPGWDAIRADPEF